MSNESFIKRWLDEKRVLRGRRALERQLIYQENKAMALKNNEREILINIFQRGVLIRKKLEKIKPISAEASVLEVGSGAHGIIFGFKSRISVGIDPLAVEYKRLFPIWQKNAQTIAAIGEKLPFQDSSFDIVLSDNVIDHAEKPFAIIDELLRVLKPSGLLYFTVNVHHPIYALASEAHGLWNSLGVRFELSPFADHTIHITEKRIKEIFARTSLQIKYECSTVNQIKAANKKLTNGSLIELLKKAFYKNAVYEVIGVKSEVL